MSRRFRGLTVTCDQLFHLHAQTPLTIMAADLETARKVLRRDGWSFPRGGAVYCPTCTRSMRPKPPREHHEDFG